MKDSSHNTFVIKTPNTNNETEEISVHHAETTDGVPYYALEIEGNEIQLRKDEDKWELIWGKLSDDQIDAIGSQIDGHLAGENQ